MIPFMSATVSRQATEVQVSHGRRRIGDDDSSAVLPFRSQHALP
jgi:hypothetical protein